MANGPNLGPQHFFRGFYLYQMLDIVAAYHYMQFQGNLLIQIQENNKKLYFVPALCPLDPNSGRKIFFFKNLASSVARYHGQLSSCTISEKTNYPILKKLSDGQTNRQTFHRTLTANVERPKIYSEIAVTIIDQLSNPDRKPLFKSNNRFTGITWNRFQCAY